MDLENFNSNLIRLSDLSSKALKSPRRVSSFFLQGRKLYPNRNKHIVLGHKNAVIYDFSTLECLQIDKKVGHFLRDFLYNGRSQDIISSFRQYCLAESLIYSSHLTRSLFAKLSLNGLWTENNIKPSLSSFAEHNRKLNGLQIELTDKCNFKCIHCYHDRSRKHNTSLVYSSILRIVNEAISSFGCKSIQLTGGEPLLYDKFHDLLNYLRKYDINVTITSNGSKITDDILDVIKENERISLQISIYTLRGAIWKEITKRDNLQHILENVDKAKQLGIPINIAAPAMMCNYHELRQLFCHFKSMGIPVKTSPLCLVGISDRFRPKLQLNRSENIKAFDYNFISPKKDNDRIRFKFRPCSCSNLSIFANGDTSVCNLLRNSQFILGNIYKDSLKSLFYGDKIAKAYKFTVDEIMICRDCEYRYLCGGGCLGISFYYWGDIRYPYPYCKAFNTIAMLKQREV